MLCHGRGIYVRVTESKVATSHSTAAELRGIVSKIKIIVDFLEKHAPPSIIICSEHPP